MNNKREVVYTFEDMAESLKQAISTFPDKRTGKNTKYKMQDAACGAFSVFFTQCPSFLSHQQLLQQRYGFSNSRTLFRMNDIPSDNHIRDLLDPVMPSSLDYVFEACFDALKQSGHLDSFRVQLGDRKNDLLIALDGTEYYSSETHHCRNCSIRIRDGQTRFCHGMVTPTIVAPGMNKVISCPPEFITPQDGDSKQDCELKAAKRYLKKQGKKYIDNVTFLGDDLYAHEPWCKQVLKKECNFIFVCKPDSHKTLYEWIKDVTAEKVEDRFDGKNHQIYTYNYILNEKGVYHINSIDEVTQWEIIAAVEKISEAYLEPILFLMLEQYPFIIIEFHADNGSEYINHTVVKLLNKLLIKLTKSRSRQTNDNALVESKNGSIIRKHMGYFYINQKYAPDINDFYLTVFNTYLNFHRPCGFATMFVSPKGKQKKIYNKYLTPFEAFKKLPDAEKYLKPGVTFTILDKIAMQYSDNEYANIMDKEKTKLFDKIDLKPIAF